MKPRFNFKLAGGLLALTLLAIVIFRTAKEISVASYIANHANDTNTQLAQLVKAIIRYGDAAYSYVN